MRLSLGDIATLLHSQCGVPERMVTGYSLDSRSIAPGQLFFAMRGPRFDGHEFVAQVIESKAAGAVVEKVFFDQAPPDLRPALVPVESPLAGSPEFGTGRTPQVGATPDRSDRQHRKEHHEGDDRRSAGPVLRSASVGRKLE